MERGGGGRKRGREREREKELIKIRKAKNNISWFCESLFHIFLCGILPSQWKKRSCPTLLEQRSQWWKEASRDVEV